MQIFVKMLTSKTVALQLQFTTPFRARPTKVDEREGISPEQQRLIEDAHTLSLSSTSSTALPYTCFCVCAVACRPLQG